MLLLVLLVLLSLIAPAVQAHGDMHGPKFQICRDLIQSLCTCQPGPDMYTCVSQCFKDHPAELAACHPSPATQERIKVCRGLVHSLCACEPGPHLVKCVQACFTPPSSRTA
jgi:hypothetical protein